MSDIERMAKLWNDQGWSMGEIAAEFALTRSKVAGIINRNREMFKSRRDNGYKPLHERRTKPRNPPQTSNERRAAFHAVKVAEEAASAPPSFPEPEIDGKEYDAMRLPMAKDLLALGNCDCRWPLNDGGPFLFCAEEVVSGSVYCRHHKGRAKGRGTESERKAIDVLKRAA